MNSPGAQTQSRRARGHLYVISAPSGAGKTSLTHALIDRLAGRGHSIRFSVSYTTRAPRPDEREGIDYRFVAEARFRDMIAAGEFLEYARVFGCFYGTARAETERVLADGHDVVLDIDWQGAQQVRRRVPGAVLVFIEPPSLAELKRRLQARGSEDGDSVARRLAEAQAELGHAPEYDYRVVNDCFDRALAALDGIFDRHAAGHAASDTL